MATVTAGMTVSLDGFVADAAGSASALYPDLADLQDTEYMAAEVARTGAVIMGRRTFAMGDPDAYVGTYEFQVPIFVITHAPPATAPEQDEHLTFTFVTAGIERAIELAKTAAGDKVVQVVGGASVIQQLLNAGLVDELQIDVMPVILGEGTRLMENITAGQPQLHKLDVREVAARTSLRFAVINA